MELSRQEFQRLAEERLEDAEALLRARRFGGAYYVAGYAVECALKACIARKTRAESWPPKEVKQTHYIHDLNLVSKSRCSRVPMVVDIAKRTTRPAKICG